MYERKRGARVRVYALVMGVPAAVAVLSGAAAAQTDHAESLPVQRCAEEVGASPDRVDLHAQMNGEHIITWPRRDGETVCVVTVGGEVDIYHTEWN